MLSDETEMKLDTKEFMNEARLMSTIPRHPNVIKLVGFSKDPIAIVSGIMVSLNNGNKQENIYFNRFTIKKQNLLVAGI